MSSSPYRVAPERLEENGSAEPNPNQDLLPVFAVVWIASVVRVVGGVMGHETFEIEPTLAFLSVLLVPVLLKDTRAFWGSRAKAELDPR